MKVVLSTVGNMGQGVWRVGYKWFKCFIADYSGVGGICVLVQPLYSYYAVESIYLAITKSLSMRDQHHDQGQLVWE